MSTDDFRPGSDADSPAPKKPLVSTLLHPAVALPVLLVAALIVAPFAFRAARVAGIPDIGPPFDMEKYGVVDAPREDNAFEDYGALSTLISELPNDETASYDATLENGWGKATDGLRKWLATNEEALARWREGAAKSEAVYQQPRAMQIDTLLPAVQTLRSVGRAALIDAARLEDEGKPDEAWQTYRALFRTSRHCGKHGCLIERLVGIALHAMVAQQIERWARRPDVSAEMLATALEQIEADDAMTAPPSRALMTEYFFVMNTLERPDMVAAAGGTGTGGAATGTRAAMWVMNEPLHCRLVLQQTFANILADCDKPFAERSPRHSGKFGLFVSPKFATANPDQLDADAIETAAGKSIMARLLLPALAQAAVAADRERARQATLRTALALQIERRKTGRFPESLNALVEHKILEAVPVDPFSPSGERLRYRRDAESVVVWSVGDNGADDGGQVATTPGAGSGNPPDYGYVIPTKPAE